MKKILLSLILTFILCAPRAALAAYGQPIASIASAAVEASHVLKNSAGTLYSFVATTGASAGYVMVLNQTTAPSNGAVAPILCYYVPVTTTINPIFMQYAQAFTTGIVIAFSTTGCFTYTSSATATFSAQIQ